MCDEINMGSPGKGETWGCGQGCAMAWVGTVDEVGRDGGDNGKEWLLRLGVDRGC